MVVTISLMILLTVIAVGLLGLASITLQSSGEAQAISVARANARLAMMLAIGDLQSSLGPDRRVSASAAGVVPSAKQPHLTGAWESWRWDPAKSDSPDYSEKSGKFQRWLVSTADPKDAKQVSLPSSDPAGEAVELIGSTVNRDTANSVRAAKIPLAEPKRAGSPAKRPASLAWAVFDESAKAAIEMDDPEKKPATTMEVATRGVPDRFRADSLNEKLVSLKTPKNLITLDTAVIPAGQSNAAEFRKRFHDFTTDSLGLLTDTANGGFKTDLTSLLESASFPTAAFPGDTLYSTVAAGAPRWSYLYDHYRKYKAVRNAAKGTPAYTLTADDLKVWNANQSLPVPGLDPSRKTERLLPVIAKLQIVFSIVSHHAHITDRIAFLDQNGVPPGNAQHAVPHFVYEPVITLFNPYDVELDLTKIRIQVWDPPVAFRFAKVMSGTVNWYRDEMTAGEFQGLARLNIGHQHDTAARRSFTLYLTDGTGQAAGTSLRLQPGEVKVFSSRVESNWSWSLECADMWSPRAFFNWNADADFGNVDHRTNNQMGVEAVPGWDIRAGIQTDHMSYSDARPQATLYDFEKLPGGPNGGFVSIRNTDEIQVEIKPQRAVGNSTTGVDFEVDVLAGNDPVAANDLLRSYRFVFADPVTEISANPSHPVISRKYKVSDTLQEWTDQSVAGKKCIAMLEMTARTTKDPLDDSKAWVYNNPVVEGAKQTTSVVGAANQSYDVRLIELTGWSSFPIIEWDPTPGPGYGRGYFGASRSSHEGVTNVPMCRVPVVPAVSLGDLIPVNLVCSSLLPRVVHPFGNSRAHPLLPANKVTRTLADPVAINGEPGTTTALDHSYFLNDTLWDRYFFSSLTDYSGGVTSDNRTRREVLKGVLDGSKPALNARLRPAPGGGDVATLAGKLDGLADPVRAKKLAAHLMVGGPFNLNSTSVDAWRSVLASLRDRDVTAWNNRTTPNPEISPFVRMALPLAGPKDTSANVNVLGQFRWAGYRSLTDTQLEALAKAIVAEIINRGTEDHAPPLTLAEFVNRRPGAAGTTHSLAGILQTAIDKSGVNTANHNLDSRSIKAADLAPNRKVGALTTEAMDGFTGEGAPSILTQGDLLGSLASIATVRGDTFKIRAYGESTSDSGSNQAKAWCEAVVQRVPDYVDYADTPDTPEADLTNRPNKSFGRRFHIVSFRWLNPREIR